MKEILQKINIKKIIGLFKTKPVFKKHHFSPKRDWLYIIVFFVLLSLFFALIALFIYKKVDSGNLWKADENVEVKTYRLNGDNLKKVTDTFDLKKVNFDNLTASSTIPKSPFP